jgi:hypothetical protein
MKLRDIDIVEELIHALEDSAVETLKTEVQRNETKNKSETVICGTMLNYLTYW